MRRLHISLTVEFGTPKDEPQGGPDLDALVERSYPEPDDRAEMDHRHRPIGFQCDPQETA